MASRFAESRLAVAAGGFVLSKVRTFFSWIRNLHLPILLEFARSSLQLLDIETVYIRPEVRQLVENYRQELS